MFCILPPVKSYFTVFVIGPYGPSGGERVKDYFSNNMEIHLTCCVEILLEASIILFKRLEEMTPRYGICGTSTSAGISAEQIETILGGLFIC